MPSSDNDRTAAADRKVRCGDAPGGPANRVLELIAVQLARVHNEPLSLVASAEANTSFCEFGAMRVTSYAWARFD